MNNLNLFRIVGTINNLIIQVENSTKHMQFYLRTVEGVNFRVHVANDVYENFMFLEELDSSLVECSGCFEMIENSVSLSLKKIFQIENTNLPNPF